MDKTKQVLKNIFGYDSFRPLQSEIINNVLKKNDSLVVMPTGGGKSICYQVPAIIFDGLTIVISPLISLMKDQVEQLRQLGVEASVLNSSLSYQEYDTNYQNVKSGKSKLLYLAPESLQKDDINFLFNELKIDCITIDEAHCISEWGHDFRKDYRQLGSFRQKLPEAVCIGLTATATPRVQNDIMKNLKMKSPKKFVASFDRTNLFLQVVQRNNGFDQTVDFLNQHKNQSGIIYCFSRKQVDNLSEDLSALGFSTKPYHAGLSDEERNTNQELFIKDKIEIIVATIAFGMGINKSNVRFVIHFNLPKNIESYYQEIGRSGRDGLRADCLLLFSYSDISKINYFIDQKESEKERMTATAHLDAIVSYAEADNCRRIPLINYFGEKYTTEDCGMCDNCTGEDIEKDDLTIPAQKFLSAIKRTGELFGAGYLIDVLTGSKSERIFHFGHQNLSVYGIGNEFNKSQWKILSRQLLKQGIIYRDTDHGSFKPTEKANDILFNNKKFFGIIEERKPKTYKSKYDDKFNHSLFELLKKRRREIAEERNIPPYIIFTDKALSEMAKYFPVTKEMFLQINGVGKKKFNYYGKSFIPIIKEFCKRNNIETDRQKGRTKIRTGKPRNVEVGEKFNDGASIEEIAEEFNVLTATVVSNLSRYVNAGNFVDLKRLKDRLTISSEKQKEVFDIFETEGIDRLKPVYEELNKEVSYEELHILKIIFLSEE